MTSGVRTPATPGIPKMSGRSLASGVANNMNPGLRTPTTLEDLVPALGYHP